MIAKFLKAKTFQYVLFTQHLIWICLDNQLILIVRISIFTLFLYFENEKKNKFFALFQKFSLNKQSFVRVIEAKENKLDNENCTY